MADQGVTKITMTVPASTARGLAISGAGTLSATLRGVGILYEPTDSTETAGIVQISGTALGTYGGNVVAGAHLVANAAGKLITQTTEADDLVMAIALQAGAANELRRIKIL